MFNAINNSWRLPDKICPIKGESYTKELKLLLFEDAIDYIKNSLLPINQLLDEIMGFKDSRCGAFKKLSIDNSFFFPSAITQEITYLIIICFIKEKYLEIQFKNDIIDYTKIIDWLSKIYKNVKLNKSFLYNLKLKLNQIYFSDSIYQKFPPIQLIKFFNLEKIQFYNTSKPQLLKINELFHNHIYEDNGRCLGAIKYFLEEMVKAYSLNKTQRNIHKNNYIKSLEVENFDFINFTVGNKIDMYQKDFCGFNYLLHLFDEYSTIDDFSISLNYIINQMNLHYLKQIYIQIITHSHALALIIIFKGKYLKCLYYDPNSLKLYFKFYIDVDNINNSLITKMYQQFKYIQKEKNKIRNLLLKVYIPKNNKPVKQIVKSLNIVEKITNIDALKDLLILGIVNHDSNLIFNIFKLNKLNLNFIFEGDNRTPLTLAICYKNRGIVSIILEQDCDIEMIDNDNKSALDYAMKIFDLELIRLLFKFGAQKNKNFENDPILSKLSF